VNGGRLGTLRDAVVEGLAAHGIASGPQDTPAALRERLSDAYLEDVRRLRERQRSGEIPLAEYAGHAEALKRRYPLLGLPLSLWTE
jgi:hypothetical protein